MNQSNFVIEDIVTHVYRDSDYHFFRIFTNAIHMLFRKLWVFLLIAALSAGIGYVAVYLPGTAAQGRGDNEDPGGMEGFTKDFQNLSDEQKQELLKRFKR